ncbi:hypothetical protein Gasu2_65130 [Galdieria sulphuraria]|nr:hypothetical protein Gasu2_65130 [Galdieria sulphuraria]
MTSGNDYPKHLSYSDGKETDSSSVRSRAAKNAVHQANILLTEQSRLQRKQRKVLPGTCGKLDKRIISAKKKRNLNWHV